MGQPLMTAYELLLFVDEQAYYLFTLFLDVVPLNL